MGCAASRGTALNETDSADPTPNDATDSAVTPRVANNMAASTAGDMATAKSGAVDQSPAAGGSSRAAGKTTTTTEGRPKETKRNALVNGTVNERRNSDDPFVPGVRQRHSAFARRPTPDDFKFIEQRITTNYHESALDHFPPTLPPGRTDTAGNSPSASSRHRRRSGYGTDITYMTSSSAESAGRRMPPLTIHNSGQRPANVVLVRHAPDGNGGSHRSKVIELACINDDSPRGGHIIAHRRPSDLESLADSLAGSKSNLRSSSSAVARAKSAAGRTLRPTRTPSNDVRDDTAFINHVIHRERELDEKRMKKKRSSNHHNQQPQVVEDDESSVSETSSYVVIHRKVKVAWEGGKNRSSNPAKKRPSHSTVASHPSPSSSSVRRRKPKPVRHPPTIEHHRPLPPTDEVAVEDDDASSTCSNSSCSHCYYSSSAASSPKVAIRPSPAVATVNGSVRLNDADACLIEVLNSTPGDTAKVPSGAERKPPRFRRITRGANTDTVQPQAAKGGRGLKQNFVMKRPFVKRHSLPNVLDLVAGDGSDARTTTAVVSIGRKLSHEEQPKVVFTI